MDFEEALKAISAMENGGDLINSIKERLASVNNEAKNLRIRTKKAEAEMMKAAKLAETLKTAGLDADLNDESLDLNESISNFLAAQKSKAVETDSTKTVEYIKLQKRLDKMDEMLKEKEANEQKLILRSQKKEIVNSLLPAFSENIMNGDTVLNLLVDSPRNPFVIEDNKVGLKLDDGDIITGSDAIIDEYKKLYPKQILNKSKSGVGELPGKTSVSIPKQFTDISQIKALDARQIANIEKNNPEQFKQMMEVMLNQNK